MTIEQTNRFNGWHQSQQEWFYHRTRTIRGKRYTFNTYIPTGMSPKSSNTWERRYIARQLSMGRSEFNEFIKEARSKNDD